MGSADDIAYRKSVRNMSLVLAAIVITIFAALYVSLQVSPTTGAFQSSVSADSALPFTLHLEINATSAAPGSNLLITGWLNSSSTSIQSINASDSWVIGPAGLWEKACYSGWPIGVGVLKGHYTLDNYTMGTLIPTPEVLCPQQVGTPGYFLLEAHSSTALVDLAGTPEYWVLQSTYDFGHTSQPGVYTVVLADEWGDVLFTNFVVS
jgi:hypothetical protein